MKISLYDSTIESESISNLVNAAIQMLHKIEADITIEKVQKWALAFLNQWRGEQRVKFGLTSTTFQELSYTGKALESQRWLSAQETDFGLSSEAAARGISNKEMAQLVLGQWQAWQVASDKVESVYWTKKSGILAALNVEEIAEILSSL